MNYKLLGKSGLRVSELALGTMTFGEEWGWGADKNESKKVFDFFAKEGGNFIDTANRYTEGTSEKFVGDFISTDREHFVVATKYTLFTRRDDPNFSGNHRKNMMQALDASLKRLKTDYIDLYWVHAWDFTTPEEEVLRALDDMIRAGKILYIGISDTPSWIVSRMNTIAELRGWTQFVGLQIKYSLIDRSVERELMPMARKFDIAVTPWAVIGGGILSGKYNRNKDEEGRAQVYKSINENNLKIAEVVIKVADEIGCTPSQVAINWVRQQPGVIIPIIGAKTEMQLKDNLGCLKLTLNEEQIIKLNEASKIDLGFPHTFLDSDNIRDIVFGGTYDKIENHHKS
ncbi:MAG: aldo/keto reductase [Ignavibacteria bacterium]|nr:aldo/keto reductase [Ignavibacteria bacterium]MBT8383538.1 aldo/keto reductase [Ignavibacteria bacterium]MBT8390495.1 aldo/keto reductase [Ignavibacteria bacterium]NNJ52565.1 aldo/keto reductase [Ignavibacteriaceae bacterium]NNL20040.1 aldo/keto reductase [Ignavibacteriaceae bacterium]